MAERTLDDLVGAEYQEPRRYGHARYEIVKFAVGAGRAIPITRRIGGYDGPGYGIPTLSELLEGICDPSNGFALVDGP